MESHKIQVPNHQPVMIYGCLWMLIWIIICLLIFMDMWCLWWFMMLYRFIMIYHDNPNFSRFRSLGDFHRLLMDGRRSISRTVRFFWANHRHWNNRIIQHKLISNSLIVWSHVISSPGCVGVCVCFSYTIWLFNIAMENHHF